jgi:hypothetical protein
MSQEPSNEPIGNLPPGDKIETLLEQLRSERPYSRRDAAQSIASQKLTDARLVEALNSIAANDANDVARNAAKKALTALGVKPPPLGPELAKKRRDFWLGVGLFFGLNILLWIITTALSFVIYRIGLPDNVNNILGALIGFLPYVINIGLTIFLAFKRPRMALGMLAGFGISLLIIICLGLLFMAVCFIAYGGSSGTY